MNTGEFVRLILSIFIFGFIIFHRSLVCYEFGKSSGKGLETQTFLSKACASAAVSEWFRGLKITAFSNFKLKKYSDLVK